ncbi:MAG TPA: hypothetical protein VMU36_12135 [Spirochaetia bacterium]|nr:hypothetical protein [Spirochaetia bacterium]
MPRTQGSRNRHARSETARSKMPFFTHVAYSVRNLGKYDLTGVNLEIGVDVYGNGTYP